VSVGLPVVIVEDHDGGHHAARHHEHDAVEVGPYTPVPHQLSFFGRKFKIVISFLLNTNLGMRCLKINLNIKQF
jgi:hypothetical protein